VGEGWGDWVRVWTGMEGREKVHGIIRTMRRRRRQYYDAAVDAGRRDATGNRVTNRVTANVPGNGRFCPDGKKMQKVTEERFAYLFNFISSIFDIFTERM